LVVHQKLNLLFEFLHPAKYGLAVFKFPPAVQLVPSYSSVLEPPPGFYHQKLNLLFEFLHLLNLYLLFLNFLLLSKLIHHILLLRFIPTGV
jgi:hypothetical protein